jgi:hypothetical protein
MVCQRNGFVHARILVPCCIERQTAAVPRGKPGERGQGHVGGPDRAHGGPASSHTYAGDPCRTRICRAEVLPWRLANEMRAPGVPWGDRSLTCAGQDGAGTGTQSSIMS